MTPKGDPAVWLSYLALVAVSFGVMGRAPAPSTVRPISGDATEQILSETRVPARLWQDPIQVGWDRIRNITGTAETGSGGNNGTKPKLLKLWAKERDTIANTIGTQCKNSKKELLVLPIIISGKTYPEAEEDRLRARYAVGAAMKHLGYTPEDSSYLDFFPVPIRKSNGEVILPEAAESSKHSEDVEFVPITREIYQRTMHGGETGQKMIVIFWIDSRLCDLAGKIRYENVKKTLDYILDSREGQGLIKCMTLLGSDDLARLLKRNGDHENKLQLWYPISSATPEVLMREAGIRSIDKAFDIYRTTPTDGRLMKALAREIKLRTRKQSPRNLTKYSLRILSIDKPEALPQEASSTVIVALVGSDLHIRIFDANGKIVVDKTNSDFEDKELSPDLVAFKKQLISLHETNLSEKQKKEIIQKATTLAGPINIPPTTWFIAEHDTLYSRSMFGVFKEELGKEFGWKAFPLRQVSYLRGLDGNLPDAPAEKSEKPAAMPHSFSGLIEQLMSRRVRTHRVFGRRQVDYMQRLAMTLHMEDKMKLSSERVKAICVMGSDVYDKLMILQSFRPLFPGAVFYTTGLDALYLQPDAAVAARNLVVIAPFGIESEAEKMDGVSHSFRNSGQTAVFDAVLEFVKTSGRAKLQSEVPCRPMGIWEVGRNHFHPLTKLEGDWGCWIPEILSDQAGNFEQAPEHHAPTCPSYAGSNGEGPNREDSGKKPGRGGEKFLISLSLVLSIPFLFLVVAAYLLQEGATGIRKTIVDLASKWWKSRTPKAFNTSNVVKSVRRLSAKATELIVTPAKQLIPYKTATLLLLAGIIPAAWYGGALCKHLPALAFVSIIILLAIGFVWCRVFSRLSPLKEAPHFDCQREARARRYGCRIIWLSLAAWILVWSTMIYFAIQYPEEPIAPIALSDGVSIWLTSIIRFGAAFFGLAALLRMSWYYIVSACRLEGATSSFDESELCAEIRQDLKWYTGGLCEGGFRIPTYIWLSGVASIGLLILNVGVFRIFEKVSSPLLIPARGELAMNWSRVAFVSIMACMVALVAVALVQHVLLSVFLSRLRIRMEHASKDAGKVSVIPAQFGGALSEHADEVSRFVVIPFAVMVLMVASTHALFDAWSIPSTMWFTLSIMLTAMLFAAFALHRQAAALKKTERRRIVRSTRGPEESPRERASDVWDDQIGIFGTWNQQPVVRALLIVAAGIGITFVEPLLGM